MHGQLLARLAVDSCSQKQVYLRVCRYEMGEGWEELLIRVALSPPAASGDRPRHSLPIAHATVSIVRFLPRINEASSF